MKNESTDLHAFCTAQRAGDGSPSKRPIETPIGDIWHRALLRARRLNVPFNMTLEEIVIPKKCPILGIQLRIGGRRTDRSPTVDRIDSSKGYLSGNVRVVSQKADRLKSERSIRQLLHLASKGPEDLRDDYAQIVAFLNLEQFLKAIRADNNIQWDWRSVERSLSRILAG